MHAPRTHANAHTHVTMSIKLLVKKKRERSQGYSFMKQFRFVKPLNYRDKLDDDCCDGKIESQGFSWLKFDMRWQTVTHTHNGPEMRHDTRKHYQPYKHECKWSKNQTYHKQIQIFNSQYALTITRKDERQLHKYKRQTEWMSVWERASKRAFALTAFFNNSVLWKDSTIKQDRRTAGLPPRTHTHTHGWTRTWTYSALITQHPFQLSWTRSLPVN